MWSSRHWEILEIHAARHLEETNAFIWDPLLINLRHFLKCTHCHPHYTTGKARGMPNVGKRTSPFRRIKYLHCSQHSNDKPGNAVETSYHREQHHKELCSCFHLLVQYWKHWLLSLKPVTLADSLQITMVCTKSGFCCNDGHLKLILQEKLHSANMSDNWQSSDKFNGKETAQWFRIGLSCC